MYLFGIVAICFAVFGMARTPKTVAGPVFAVVQSFEDYAVNVTGEREVIYVTYVSYGDAISAYGTSLRAPPCGAPHRHGDPAHWHCAQCNWSCG